MTIFPSPLLSEKPSSEPPSPQETPPNPLLKDCTIYKEYKMEVPQEVTQICEDFKEIGATALVVGGSVRDMVYAEHADIEVHSKDFDLEIFGVTQETILAKLKARFGEDAVSLEGASYNIIKVHIPGWIEPLDIGLPRIDEPFGISHRAVKTIALESPTIVQAAIRRDTKANALFYGPLTQELYDPFGGVENIKQGVVEMIAPETFGDDPLRVLRLAQFVARFGWAVEEKTLEKCKELVALGQVAQAKVSASQEGLLSSERVSDEFRKLLTQGWVPSVGFEFMREVGLFNYPPWEELGVLAENPDLWQETMRNVNTAAEFLWESHSDGTLLSKAVLARLEGIEDPREKVKARGLAVRDAKTSVMLPVLMAHFEEAGVEASQFLAKFNHNHFSEAVEVKVLSYLAESPADTASLVALSDYELLKMTDRFVKPAGNLEEFLSIAWIVAEDGGGGVVPVETLQERVLKLGVLEGPLPALINGDDLRGIGLKPGPIFGELLGMVRDAQLKGEVQTRDGALRLVSSFQ